MFKPEIKLRATSPLRPKMNALETAFSKMAPILMKDKPRAVIWRPALLNVAPILMKEKPEKLFFEPFSFKIGEAASLRTTKRGKISRRKGECFYTPDFIAVFRNDVEVHEVKGRRWEDGIIKFKVCAWLYLGEEIWGKPINGFYMWEKKKGNWRVIYEHS